MTCPNDSNDDTSSSPSVWEPNGVADEHLQDNDGAVDAMLQQLAEDYKEDAAVDALETLHPTADRQTLRSDVRKGLQAANGPAIRPHWNAEAASHLHTDRAKIKQRPRGITYVSNLS
jgi:hypothetical protein